MRALGVPSMSSSATAPADCFLPCPQYPGMPSSGSGYPRFRDPTAPSPGIPAFMPTPLPSQGADLNMYMPATPRNYSPYHVFGTGQSPPLSASSSSLLSHPPCPVSGWPPLPCAVSQSSSNELYGPPGFPSTSFSNHTLTSAGTDSQSSLDSSNGYSMSTDIPPPNPSYWSSFPAEIPSSPPKYAVNNVRTPSQFAYPPPELGNNDFYDERFWKSASDINAEEERERRRRNSFVARQHDDSMDTRNPTYGSEYHAESVYDQDSFWAARPQGEEHQHTSLKWAASVFADMFTSSLDRNIAEKPAATVSDTLPNRLSSFWSASTSASASEVCTGKSHEYSGGGSEPYKPEPWAVNGAVRPRPVGCSDSGTVAVKKYDSGSDFVGLKRKCWNAKDYKLRSLSREGREKFLTQATKEVSSNLGLSYSTASREENGPSKHASGYSRYPSPVAYVDCAPVSGSADNPVSGSADEATGSQGNNGFQEVAVPPQWTSMRHTEPPSSLVSESGTQSWQDCNIQQAYNPSAPSHWMAAESGSVYPSESSTWDRTGAHLLETSLESTSVTLNPKVDASEQVANTRKADDMVDGLPATSFNPEDLEATSFNPGDLEATSFNPGDMEATSFNPEDLEATSFNPEDLKGEQDILPEFGTLACCLENVSSALLTCESSSVNPPMRKHIVSLENAGRNISECLLLRLSASGMVRQSADNSPRSKMVMEAESSLFADTSPVTDDLESAGTGVLQEEEESRHSHSGLAQDVVEKPKAGSQGYTVEQTGEATGHLNSEQTAGATGHTNSEANRLSVLEQELQAKERELEAKEAAIAVLSFENHKSAMLFARTGEEQLAKLRQAELLIASLRDELDIEREENKGAMHLYSVMLNQARQAAACAAQEAYRVKQELAVLKIKTLRSEASVPEIVECVEELHKIHCAEMLYSAEEFQKIQVRAALIKARLMGKSVGPTDVESGCPFAIPAGIMSEENESGEEEDEGSASGRANASGRASVSGRASASEVSGSGSASPSGSTSEGSASPSGRASEASASPSGSASEASASGSGSGSLNTENADEEYEGFEEEQTWSLRLKGGRKFKLVSITTRSLPDSWKPRTASTASRVDDLQRPDIASTAGRVEDLQRTDMASTAGEGEGEGEGDVLQEHYVTTSDEVPKHLGDDSVPTDQTEVPWETKLQRAQTAVARALALAFAVASEELEVEEELEGKEDLEGKEENRVQGSSSSSEEESDWEYV